MRQLKEKGTFVGDIYSGSSLVAVIDSEGYVSSNNKQIGRVDASYVYDTNGNQAGRFESNGYIYDRMGNQLGRVDGGTVYDSSGSTVGRADPPHQMGGAAALLLLIR